MPIRALSCTTILAFALHAVSTNGFVPATGNGHLHTFTLGASTVPSLDHSDHAYLIDDRTNAMAPTSTIVETPKEEKKISPPKSGSGGGAVHKKGIFSPVVQVSKIALGSERLNKVRAKVISMHSDVISSFVSTADTALGNLVLRQLFRFADKDGSGAIDETELRAALQTLGFDWLQEKQITGIFERADMDTNGAIDMDEWIKEAPRTLRTNLIKLAKKNGGDMGLLV
jgi:EF hand